MLHRLQKFLRTRGVPASLQLAALCLLTCLVLLGGMWGCSYVGMPGLARIFNVLLLFALFVSVFFLTVAGIVLLIGLSKILLDFYASR
jgi:hypothetical protein